MDKYQNILSNPIINFIMGSAISILVGFVFYKKSSLKKIPQYHIFNETLININDTKINKYLKLTYDNVDIKTLHCSTILFFNNGNATIRKFDLLNDNKLRLKFNDNICKLLKVEYASTNKIGESFKIEQKHAELYISFDAIQKHQGFLLKFYHTSDNKNPLILLGDLDGVNKIERISYFKMSTLLYSKIQDNRKEILRNLKVIFISIILFLVGLIISLLESFQSVFGIVAMITLLSLIPLFAFTIPTIISLFEIVKQKKYIEFTKLIDKTKEFDLMNNHASEYNVEDDLENSITE